MSESSPRLITCVVQRGFADIVVEAAMEAGAEGATIYYGRGTGVRQKLGLPGSLIKPQKEIILIITKKDQADKIFDTVTKAARLDEKGRGFAFQHAIDRAIGFL